ncbi:Ubiquitin supergroup [Macleaya cordata]|uniref:Ubiquitin supergroup n=1 Tax=Macleaya cordata TaxID=56857 RepID=A0A200R474_MACCD|nr:Ubiquitin supergroup [Macleaya cordata]
MDQGGDEPPNEYFMRVSVTNMHSGFNCIDSGNFKDVESLRRHIVPPLGIAYENQIVVYNGKLLLDTRTEFANLGIEDRADFEIYHKISPQMIDVVVETKSFDLHLHLVPSKITVLTLKRMIDERIGVSPRRQDLKVMNIFMNDVNFIDEYVTCNPLEVYLMETPQDPRWFRELTIIVPGTDKSITVDEVEIHDTVHTLHALARRIGLAEGYNFYLEWKGLKLEGHRTLYECGIRRGDTIYLYA